MPPNARHNNEVQDPVCVIHTNVDKKSDHFTEDCHYFASLSTENKWIVMNQDRMCPFCLHEKHPVKDCPKRNERDMCKKCRYTHAALMGCIPSKTERFLLNTKIYEVEGRQPGRRKPERRQLRIQHNHIAPTRCTFPRCQPDRLTKPEDPKHSRLGTEKIVYEK